MRKERRERFDGLRRRLEGESRGVGSAVASEGEQEVRRRGQSGGVLD